jgi:MFS family permease
VPFYPLYSLLFASTGLSDGDISVLFVIWTGVGLVAEVPMGALADRFSRRASVVAAGVAQAAGYVLWTALPGFGGFAFGFVLWGLGGALSSGAFEALLYDGLVAAGTPQRYARLLGRVRAAELLAQLPTAGLATALFAAGGYRLVGWVSVGTCLVTAALATLLPEAPRTEQADDDGPGYLATLRAGLAEVTASPALRGAVLAVALLGGLDALEEYFPLLAGHWGVPVVAIPAALLAIPVAGAAGAALGGRFGGLGPAALTATLGAGVALLGAVGLWQRPAGLAGVAVFYGLYRLVWLVADARMQERIAGTARATATSVAELGVEVTCLLVYGAWSLGRLTAVAALALAVTIALQYCLSSPAGRRDDR